jgi:hypothetical protein
MELTEFQKEFIENVKSTAAAEGDFEKSAFVNECAKKLIEAEELDEFEPCYYEGTGRRNRRLMVHGYSFDEVDESVKLVISNYVGTEELETLTQTDLTKLFERLTAFAEEAVKGQIHPEVDESSPYFGLAYELYRRREEIRYFKFYLVTDQILSNRVKDIPEGNISGIRIEYSVWDIARFHRVHESKAGKDPLFIDFLQYTGKEVYCLRAGEKQGEYQAYLCMIPGEVVAKIYDRFGSRLLEGNVRSFLSTKVKVNKGIRNTILNEPEMFFAYNNGISATATDAIFNQTEQGLQLVSASDLQIVNGGQTTASLLMAKIKDKADLSNVFVQMKLSVVSSTTADTVIPLIARYANSQNNINDADFFANHPFHVRIEGFSRSKFAPAVGVAQYGTYWFYERARGQYLNEQSKMTSSEKKKFVLQNPRNQLITKTDLGKYYFSWEGYPHLVSLGPQKNFKHFAEWITKKWNESDLVFNEDFFKNCVTNAIIFKRTEKLVSDQPWYQNNFRPNIVTYTVAMLSHFIQRDFSGFSLDLKVIWNRQEVPDIVVKQLEVISKAVFDVIMDPEMGIQIITEWCKKPRCWEKIKLLDIESVRGFEACLVSLSEVKKVERQSRNQQKVDNGIDAQVRVVNLGADYWERLRKFAKQNNLVTIDEDKLLNLASKMSSGIMPTDKQCLRLLVISDRLTGEGFVLQAVE